MSWGRTDCGEPELCVWEMSESNSDWELLGLWSIRPGGPRQVGWTAWREGSAMFWGEETDIPSPTGRAVERGELSGAAAAKSVLVSSNLSSNCSRWLDTVSDVSMMCLVSQESPMLILAEVPWLT